MTLPEDLNNPSDGNEVSAKRVFFGSTYGASFYIAADLFPYEVFEQMAASNYMLGNLRVRAATGPIQFDVFRDHARKSSQGGSLPLVWAENVQRYTLRPSKQRVGKEWLSQDILDTVKPNVAETGIIIQRVTANEQPRRIIATLLDGRTKGVSGAYSENHTNFIDFSGKDHRLAAYVLAVLNSRAIDLVFRHLNSNTQVSAGELNYLPIPPPPDDETLSELSDLVFALLEAGGVDCGPEKRLEATRLDDAIDRRISDLYGFTEADHISITRRVTSVESVYSL